jgi:predicted GNAT family acetyltransferase
MTVERLSELEHANFIAAIEAVAVRRRGSLIRREGGVAVLGGGGPIRLFNQLMVEADEATAETVARGIADLRAGGFRFVVNLREGRDDRFLPLMAELGLQGDADDDLLPGMAISPIPAARPGPPGLEIRRVADAAALHDHSAVIAGGFGMDESIVAAFLDDEMAEDSRFSFYVGSVDGRPVTSSMGYPTGSTIGVYNVATLPEARGHGYGAAMTMRVLEDGVRAGCDVGTLQSSAAGFPVYTALGFRTVVRYRGFIVPEPTEPAGG